MSGSIAWIAAVARFANSIGVARVSQENTLPRRRLCERDVEHIDRVLVERVIANVAGYDHHPKPGVSPIRRDPRAEWIGVAPVPLRQRPADDRHLLRAEPIVLKYSPLTICISAWGATSCGPTGRPWISIPCDMRPSSPNGTAAASATAETPGCSRMAATRDVTATRSSGRW